MRRLLTLSRANLKSFVRDRAALFWTLAFPVAFVLLFGTLFSGGEGSSYSVGWVDLDATPASAQLRAAVAEAAPVKLHDGTFDEEQSAMRAGDVDGIIVIPKGAGATIAAGRAGQATSPAVLTLVTDPSRSTTSQALTQIANGIVTGTNAALSGRPPALGLSSQSIQTQQLNGVSYFVPSILAMALMQLGIFASIPLVQQREKLILKRLSATPLPRWTLVASNIAVRLVIAAAQTVLILGIGFQVLHVQVTGDWLAIAAVVTIGALVFTSIGYVIASFARTEEAANGMTSIVQFPLMFLSGIFIPLEVMPDWLRGVATFMPLTYLGDALRQTMVGGAPFVPLDVDLLILAGWLLASFVLSARFFRWQ
jgi:ABC-2 type transport system permease protein